MGEALERLPDDIQSHQYTTENAAQVDAQEGLDRQSRLECALDQEVRHPSTDPYPYHQVAKLLCPEESRLRRRTGTTPFQPYTCQDAGQVHCEIRRDGNVLAYCGRPDEWRPDQYTRGDQQLQ